MKKVFLLISISGLIFVVSCKKEEKNQVNNTEEHVTEVVQTEEADGNSTEVSENSGVEVTPVPQIDDSTLQEWVIKLHDEAVKAKQAFNQENQAGIKEAITEITSLVEVLNTLKDKPDYQKAEDYYKQIQAELE